MRIIAGLGNPEDKYYLTRHNAGFLAVDQIANLHNADWNYNKKFKSDICALFGGTDGNKSVLLVKPRTYMNKSGEAIANVLNYYHLLPKRLGFIPVSDAPLADSLTVIHDDLDIELGKFKISLDSRSAGNRGVQSIIDRIKTKNFTRVRIGIRALALIKIPAEKFVLQKFSPDEMKTVSALIDDLVRRELKLF
ncbi:MAG: aminoacyl-tRNA hydrolase [Patescibacteria group bacterium]|jgi:PTH1 family peptidyl-tRNA hydrolase